MEFWHGSNSGNVLGLQATATEELDTSVPSTPLAQRFSAVAPSKSFEFPAPPPQEEGNTPLAAAERGEIGMSTSPGGPSTSANGRGAGHGAGMASPPGSPGRKGANRSSSVFYSSSLASASNDAWSHRHVGNADAEAAERGPTASWSSLRQWWQYKGRYKEWRRDVRWKMFNRRVRTATEMFTELFGDDFDAIIPIYPTDSVDKLISQWDCKCAELERAQVKLREIAANEADEEAKQGRPVERTQRREKQVARLKAKIATLMTKVADLQEKIIRERDAVLSDLPSTCFFATFKSQEAAAIAAQANLNPVSQRLFNVEPAPSPDDVNWPSLTRSWWQRQSRTLYVLPLILLIMLFPIGAFTGAFAQLTIAICGNPMDGSPALAADSWFCSDDPWASFLRNLITSLAPSILLSVYHMVLLPVLVYYAAQAEGQCLSLSKLDRRCADLFFYW